MPRPGPQRKGKRQRFYARNAVKTTLEPRPAAVPGCAWAFDAIVLGQLSQFYTAQIHPALTSFADECCGTLARPLVYVGTLAPLAIFGLHLWDQLPADETSEPAAGPGWSTASRAYPAFAVSQFDLPGKTETYDIPRHPQGGRKASCTGRPTAKGRLPNWKFIVLATKSAPRDPPAPESATEWTPMGGASRSRPGWLTSQDAGFHETFLRPLHFCDPVWPD